MGESPERRALITGITGQDGSYLAEFLLDKGYEVHGIIRRASTFNTARIDHLYQDRHEDDRRLTLHYGDMADGTNLTRLMTEIQPHEVYNLAAQSHVRTSFDIPEYTADATALGTLRLLDAMRDSGTKATLLPGLELARCSATRQPPQSETTPFQPRSPYAISKLFAYWTTVNYRESYGIFASNGILFNHESPRRGETFVTRKVTRSIARILAGKEQLPLPRQPRRAARLGLRARVRRGDVADAAAGPAGRLRDRHGREPQVREFVETAFELVGLNWADYVRFDPRYVRPAEVDHLPATRPRRTTKLGWKPQTDVPGASCARCCCTT